MFQVKLFASAFCVFVVIASCQSSYLKVVEDFEAIDPTEASDLELIETPEKTRTDSAEEASTEGLQNDESLSTDETLPVEINHGRVFRLKMTIVEYWNDGYLDKSSKVFEKLAMGLGAELIDLVDNSQEANDLNVTHFQLVEVQPSKDSIENIYVTFIVSSRKDISGEDLSYAISNRINLYSAIYDYKATHDGFLLENVTQEEIEKYGDVTIICGADSLTELPQLELNTTTHSLPKTADDDSNCYRETIQRGLTSIYILENQQQCIEKVRNNKKQNNLTKQDDQLLLDDIADSSETQPCSKNFKRSAYESEDETVIIVRKRGNKVFIEM